MRPLPCHHPHPLTVCFLVLAYRQHPRYPLILATNRDEFYARPTDPVGFWKDKPQILAGRDLKGGGTWMGVTRAGRYAALTNYRNPDQHDPEAPTRGMLVADYLAGALDPRAYLERLRPTADRYNGFNLLVGDPDRLYYFSNQDPAIRALTPGLYGLSNHLLDTPWPKVERGKRELAAAIEGGDVDPDELFAFLTDTHRASDKELPDTGVGLTWERVLSSIFIESPTYGTRCSTILLMDAEGHVTYVERTYPVAEDEDEVITRRFVFEIDQAPVS